MNSNTVLDRPDAETVDAPEEFDPYRNEADDSDGSANARLDILPEADASDGIDLERNLARDAGMRDGGLTGSIEEER